MNLISGVLDFRILVVGVLVSRNPSGILVMGDLVTDVLVADVLVTDALVADVLVSDAPVSEPSAELVRETRISGLCLEVSQVWPGDLLVVEVPPQGLVAVEVPPQGLVAVEVPPGDLVVVQRSLGELLGPGESLNSTGVALPSLDPPPSPSQSPRVTWFLSQGPRPREEQREERAAWVAEVMAIMSP